MALSWAAKSPGGVVGSYVWPAISNDGQKVLIAGNSGRLWQSLDSCESWSEIQVWGASDLAYQVAYISGDGSTLAVCVNGGRIGLSTDGGATWAETQPAGNANKAWFDLDGSDDGQTILACVAGSGRLWLTKNAGATWAEARPLGNADGYWQSCAVSGNGQVLLASTSGGRLWLSTNGGSSWAETRPTGVDENKDWYISGISADGAVIFAVDSEMQSYRSANAGGSWSTFLAGVSNRRIEVDPDCSVLLTQTQPYYYKFWYSVDGGAGWVESNPGSDTNHTMRGAVNSDGSIMVVATTSGHVYRGTGLPADPLPVSGDAFLDGIWG